MLLLIYLNIRRYINKYLLDQKIFIALIYSDALILILDTIMWLLDGKPGDAVHGYFSAVTVVYYVFNPGAAVLWYLYAEFYVNRNESRLKKLIAPLALPLAAILALAVIGLSRRDMLFYIDSANVYHRGPLFFVMALTSFAFVAASFILVLLSRKKLQKSEFRTLLFFPTLPFIGGVAQSLFYGISTLWICATVALLIIFINFQNSQLSTDHLTGLYNRRQLDNFLHAKSQIAGGKVVAGLMIDVNHFKAINDSYGHDAGDQALTHVADILKKTFRESDFIARYGGDEFVVVMELSDRADLEKALGRLQANIAQFNGKALVPYDISLSIGSGFYEPDGNDASAFMKRIDSLMYAEKERFKNEFDCIPKQ